MIQYHAKWYHAFIIHSSIRILRAGTHKLPEDAGNRFGTVCVCVGGGYEGESEYTGTRRAELFSLHRGRSPVTISKMPGGGGKGGGVVVCLHVFE